MSEYVGLWWAVDAMDVRRERMGLDARDEYEAEQQAAEEAIEARAGLAANARRPGQED